jgi:phosphoesterase RecJ-like protein
MIENVLSLIHNHDRFFITTHIRPDGDALGSELAFGLFLRKLGKEVVMLNSDPPPINMDWLPELGRVELFDGSLEQRKKIDAADVLFILDTNALDRLGKLVGPVRNARGVKALIDHHTRPEAWFDVTYVRETASSTGELIYEIIAAQDPHLIDAEIATALYSAIMTDTGSFRFSNVTPAVHRVVADILERGCISAEPIHTAIYETRTPESLRLLSRVLDTITLRHGGKIAYAVITPRVLDETGAASDEADGFVNYALSIEGVVAAVQFLETEGGTKMSFRSKSDVHVNDWARAFGGGGHKNAAGAFLNVPLPEAIEQVISAAPRYIALGSEDEEEAMSDDDASYLAALIEMKSQEK